MLNKKGYIYLIETYQDDYGYVYKIGRTKNKVNDRLITLECGNPNEMRLICSYESSIRLSTLEARIHKRYSSKRIKGEWFNLSKDEVTEFLETCKLLEDALILVGYK